MAAKNTKKKTKAPLKKSAMRRVHGGTDDGASGVGSTSNLPPPTLSGKAVAGGAEKIALVGMSCQSSVPPVMDFRKAGKVARRFALNIGLLCSKTFDDAIFPELFEAKYGL